ncbi:MAG: glycerol acyltransferase [Bacteroidales bacterium]
METLNYTQIDIEKIIANKRKRKNSGVLKLVINLLKLILHQDTINVMLKKNKGYTGYEFTTHILEELNVQFRIHSKTELDSNKSYLFVSNHPLGGLDGLIFISYLGKKFGNIKAPANDLLISIKELKDVFVPINKYGKMNFTNANTLNNAFNSGSQFLFFPAGLCSRLIKGEIKDLRWKNTFVKKAVEYKRDIVPMYFSGKNSMFFYRVAKLRKFFKIKFNIETIFLPNEMFKQKNTIFDIYIGNPIPYSTINKDYSYNEWTHIIRNKCYDLNK